MYIYFFQIPLLTTLIRLFYLLAHHHLIRRILRQECVRLIISLLTPYTLSIVAPTNYLPLVAWLMRRDDFLFQQDVIDLLEALFYRVRVSHNRSIGDGQVFHAGGRVNAE